MPRCKGEDVGVRKLVSTERPLEEGSNDMRRPTTSYQEPVKARKSWESFVFPLPNPPPLPLLLFPYLSHPNFPFPRSSAHGIPIRVPFLGPKTQLHSMKNKRKKQKERYRKDGKKKTPLLRRMRRNKRFRFSSRSSRR